MIAVVYGSASKLVRRVIVSDELKFDAVPVVDGEAVFEISDDEYAKFGPDDLCMHITKTLGEPTITGRCVELDDTGKVVGVLRADPEIDKAPAAKNTLVLHDKAEIGDVKVGAVFVSTKPVVEATEAPVGSIPWLAARGL
jgi:hypothetical protein